MPDPVLYFDPNLLLLCELMEMASCFVGETRETLLISASQVWDLVMGS